MPLRPCTLSPPAPPRTSGAKITETHLGYQSARPLHGHAHRCPARTPSPAVARGWSDQPPSSTPILGMSVGHSVFPAWKANPLSLIWIDPTNICLPESVYTTSILKCNRFHSHLHCPNEARCVACNTLYYVLTIPVGHLVFWGGKLTR